MTQATGRKSQKPTNPRQRAVWESMNHTPPNTTIAWLTKRPKIHFTKSAFNSCKSAFVANSR